MTVSLGIHIMNITKSTSARIHDLLCILKNLTSNANIFICSLNEASSEESTSFGKAIQSHHLQILCSDSSYIVQI